MDVERIQELDDGRVPALLTLRARGRGSGAPVDSEYAHILTFRDGLCLRVDGFPTWKALSRPPGWRSRGVTVAASGGTEGSPAPPPRRATPGSPSRA
jgi:hypothetical protein